MKRYLSLFIISILIASTFIGFERASAVGTISISPTSGPSGTNVTVTGSGFPPNTTVGIIFDGNRFLSDVTATNAGSFTKSVTIPSDVSVGGHTLVANDGSNIDG